MPAATRARGCLFGILGVLLGLGLVGGGVDVGARHYATGRIEQRIKTDLPDARGVHGRIHSFPFLKVFVSGHIDEIGAHIDQLLATGVTFTSIDVDLRGVVIQPGPLATEGRVTVKRIRTGTATATISAPALQALLKLTAPLGALTVSVDAANHTLSLASAGVAITLPLPTADLLPCAPSTHVQPGGALTLSCSFTRVPTALTTFATS